MTLLAHLSDLHLLEADHGARRGLLRRRLAYLSAGRPHDAADRRRRALAALTEARRSGADHVVVTGDLTEDGIPAQFEVLAEVLFESGLAPEKVTLLAGNHDVYDAPDAFARALAGPLAPYARNSAPGVLQVIGDVALLPLSTAVSQPYHLSAGSMERAELTRADALGRDGRGGRRTAIVAMHHPPHRRQNPVMQLFDGFRDHRALGQILEEHDGLCVLHGHLHEQADRGVRPGARPRIFGIEAVVSGAAPVRCYRAEHGHLLPLAA